MVFKGTNEFKIEAIALSISVSAIAKKKAGKKEPNNPEMIIHFQCSFFLVLNRGSMTRVEMHEYVTGSVCLCVKVLALLHQARRLVIRRPCN